jgi:hypothetical protein
MKSKISVILFCMILFLTVFVNNTMSLKQDITKTIINKSPSKLDWRDVDGEDWTTPIRDQIQDECGIAGHLE